MRPATIAALLLALAACGSEPERPPSPRFDWVPVAGMLCADGTPTGIGVSRGSADVLVFLDGGGACWSASACSASPGPFGAAQLGGREAVMPGTVLDRGLAHNPFAGWTMLFVPYCTGDVHAGDSAWTSYGWLHHGRKNVGAALAWAAASFPAPPRLVIAGSSAGGFGTLLAYDLVRTRWPIDSESPTSVALVDDSGPTLVTTAISSILRDAWWDAWNLASTVTPLCPSCQGDLSAIWDVMSASHPTDRFGLLSATEDATMRAFLGGMTGLEFTDALDQLAGKLEALPDGNARTFRVSGTDHALLSRPGVYTAGGTPLLRWLSAMAAGDPWTSKGP